MLKDSSMMYWGLSSEVGRQLILGMRLMVTREWEKARNFIDELSYATKTLKLGLGSCLGRCVGPRMVAKGID
jgi:hypothetical protein